MIKKVFNNNGLVNSLCSLFVSSWTLKGNTYVSLLNCCICQYILEISAVKYYESLITDQIIKVKSLEEILYSKCLNDIETFLEHRINKISGKGFSEPPCILSIVNIEYFWRNIRFTKCSRNNLKALIFWGRVPRTIFFCLSKIKSHALELQKVGNYV